MRKIRKRIYEIIEIASERDRLSNVYDIFMMLIIIASTVQLCFKTEYYVFNVIDKVALVVFIIDYALRLFTADLKLQKGWLSFVLYPFTFLAIIDLLCILTALNFVNNAFRALKIFRLLRTLRVLRLFKTVRYSKSINMMKNVFIEQRKALLTVGLVAVVYIFVSAVVIFNVEPESFNTFFDAIYWATISLTTVGYGDIYPVSTAGRVITMISSVFGIGIIALPSGIITAGFLKEMTDNRSPADDTSTDGVQEMKETPQQEAAEDATLTETAGE
jgi:voltage-gated potassium channel